MKKLFILSLIMGSFLACNSAGAGGKAGGKNGLLAAKDFEAKMNELDNEFVIDLRSHGELHGTGPIAGARNIDFDNGQFEKVYARFPKEKPVMLYCASGGRSAKAAQMLKDAGFEQVYDLEGGVEGWKAAGLPIEAHAH